MTMNTRVSLQALILLYHKKLSTVRDLLSRHHNIELSKLVFRRPTSRPLYNMSDATASVVGRRKSVLRQISIFAVHSV